MRDQHSFPFNDKALLLLRCELEVHCGAGRGGGEPTNSIGITLELARNAHFLLVTLSMLTCENC